PVGPETSSALLSRPPRRCGDGLPDIIQPWSSNLADAILADATRVLRNADSSTDVARDVTLVRRGSIDTFTARNGIINTQSDFNAIIDLDGYVKVVDLLPDFAPLRMRASGQLDL